MHTMLAQLNQAVPGVLGSLVCDGDGRLLAHAFPKEIEVARVEGAAALLAERSAALDGALGGVTTLDLRCASARIVVKASERARLLFLCAPSVNVPLLSLSAAGALRKVSQLTAASPPAAAAAPAAASLVAHPPPPPAPAEPARGELFRTVERIDALLARHGAERFKLRGQIAMKAGFALDLADPDAPDDPEQLKRLHAAAAAVLGARL
jgi:predicted regulator of Ras-like GTPase activity (Roadblock/LC7/MglB family)